MLHAASLYHQHSSVAGALECECEGVHVVGVKGTLNYLEVAFTPVLLNVCVNKTHRRSRSLCKILPHPQCMREVPVAVLDLQMHFVYDFVK